MLPMCLRPLSTSKVTAAEVIAADDPSANWARRLGMITTRHLTLPPKRPLTSKIRPFLGVEPRSPTSVWPLSAAYRASYNCSWLKLPSINRNGGIRYPIAPGVRVE